MSGGGPVKAEASLSYGNGVKNFRSLQGFVENTAKLKNASFSIAAHGAGELKVLAHIFTANGSSSPLKVILKVEENEETRLFDLKLKLMDGSLLMPIKEMAASV